MCDDCTNALLHLCTHLFRLDSPPLNRNSDHMQDALSSRHDNRWECQRLDWSINFPRSGQHLSNQLRGKRMTSQMELFEDVFSGLKPEIQKQVKEKDISVVGLSLSVSQARAYESGLRLLACSNYQSNRLVITPDDWLKAYDLQMRDTTRGSKQVSGQERHDAFAALISLAGIPWLVSYKKLENGKWYLIQRVTTLWKVEFKSLLGNVDSDANKVTPDRISEIEKIAIEFDEVWLDQREQYYFYKPARLYTRLALSMPGKIKRQPQHLHPFLDWIFAEAGHLRVMQKSEPAEKQSWTISASWMDLAHQCRMTKQLQHRNYRRVQQYLQESAQLAQNAQIISDHKFDGDNFTVTFDHRIFADLDEYLDQQRTKQKRRQARNPEEPKKPRSSLWKDRSRYSLAEINKLITEHEEAAKVIRSRIRYNYDVNVARSVPERDFTPEEQAHLQHHREAIQELKEIKLGVKPLAG